MPTELLFRQDAYLRETPATVEAVNERGGIILDRTNFYATGGGQPGDAGHLRRADGSEITIATTIYDPEDKSRVIHVPAEGQALPAPGEAVTVVLDWERRFKRMRVHTALHLLSVVLTFPVTGGSIGEGDGRLDFDIPEGGLDKAEISEKLNALVARNADVTERWITDEELDANPGLVKTPSAIPPCSPGAAPMCATPPRSARSRSPISRRRASRTGASGSRSPENTKADAQRTRLWPVKTSSFRPNGWLSA